MPFKSLAQLRKFGSMLKAGQISQAVFDEWLHATPNVGGLPEHIHKQKKRKKGKTRSY
jgi:hypothetical protein